MIQTSEILDTLRMMIDREKLDVRTITMGISLFPATATTGVLKAARKVYDKITRNAENLVAVGEEIERKLRHPHYQQAHLRHAPSPHPGGAAGRDPRALCRGPGRGGPHLWRELHRRVLSLGAQGAFDPGDRRLIASIPQALTRQSWCAPRERGHHQGWHQHGRRGEDGPIIRETAQRTADRGVHRLRPSWWCSANAPEDNPFMAGAFHGPGEGDCAVSVGVSGPGVVRAAISKYEGRALFEVAAETIKRTAFKITRMGQLVAQEAAAACACPFRHCGFVLSPHPGHRRQRGLSFWKAWVWSSAAPTAPPPLWRCSTTQ